ncbi:tRNA-uridine aminocarboxypropyltransferase [Marinomonas profundimaris]|uniref:tRNA-uridine aminocarboxypropyltransferase n=1 Tax=Marinomonas profundimaris TaxID=1208321 RepID=W1RZT8_9GAMM|nr:tRNA-uridine aminocarboxypropyltransferase [Marinomonas profundimaris]ETI62482.1 hypothetical protein D104_01705 [Marinomonas profundimaris]
MPNCLDERSGQRVSRAVCANCGFLLTQCVCEWIPALSTRLKILIVQDPKEATHAKNTVPLLCLGLASVTCVSTNDVDALQLLLIQKDAAKWRLVFPSDDAMPVEAITASEASCIEGLILLDATWRKAKKMYLTEPLLHRFDAVCFSRPPSGQYSIRKSPSDVSLSTLEACAYSIEQVSGENMQPLRAFMVAAQAWQWRRQPLSHRHD